MESTHLQTGGVKDQLSDVTPSLTPLGTTGMQRDHESIDDFEHLEPESSPVKETAVKVTQELLDKFVSMEQESAAGSGRESIVSGAKAPESQNSSDFSLLSDSKLDSPVAENISSDLGEEMVVPLSPTKMIDVTNAYKANDKNLPDLPVFEKKLSPVLSQSEGLLADLKTSVQSDFDILFSKGKDVVTKVESLSDPKAIAQSFMTTERVELMSEVPKDDQLDKYSDIEFLKYEGNVSKDDTSGKFSDDLEFLGYESHPEPIQSFKESDSHIPAEPEALSALAHIRDDMHDDDSFKDTDSIPEVIKPGDKLIDILPEDPKSYQSAGDGNEEDDIEDEDYDIPVVQSPIKLSDKLEQYQIKPHEMRYKTEPEPEPQPIGESLPTGGTVPKHDILGRPAIKITSTVSEPTIKSVPPIADNIKSPSASRPNVQVSTVNEESAEPVMFGGMAFDAWFKPDRLHPKVVELVYWRDPKKSGILFGSVLGILLSLSYFSLISVVAYLSLAVLTGTISYRIYKNVMQALQKTSDGHPFKDILDLDLTLPQDKVREVTDNAVAHLNAAVAELRHLFLVEDLVDSIKFGILLWCLTYVGSWFNGMTLIIIAFVALFTLPKVYENNKTQIDQNVEIVRSKLMEITAKVKTLNPMSKKPPTEEKKEQ